jgi:hypothetical protein
MNTLFSGGSMRHFNPALLLLASLTVLSAQETASTSPITTSSVPRLIRFGSSFKPANGLPPQPTEGATLSIYREEQGGTPLWQETQNVAVSAEGRYNLLLGSTVTDGLPMELLTAGEPRWLGVTFNRPGEVEQPRVRLASVPYALKAVDAETLGGIPASAYLRDPSAPISTTGAIGSSTGTSATTAGTNAVSGKSVKPHATSGTTNFLGVFTNATDLGSSALYQNGMQIGLNTTTPLDFLHARFADTSGVFTGYAVQNLSSGASSYSGMLFYDQNNALGQFQGFNNSTHEYRINNIASGGSINFMIGSSSKFFVGNNGNIGIGTSSPQSKLDVAGDVNLTGSLRFGGSVVLRMPNSTSFGLGTNALSNSTGIQNTAAGFLALAADTTGGSNTAFGLSALGNNTTGSLNTAVGIATLSSNISGTNNTAVGNAALFGNTVGTFNAAIGTQALGGNTTGTSNTAVGAGALSSNTTGSNNVAVGDNAAANVGAGNSNNIHIANQGASGDSGVIRIGTPGTQSSFFVAGVNGVTTTNSAVPVLIDTTNGQLGVTSSSRRYKEDIQDMGDSSRALMHLRPVTFLYKKSFADGTKPIQYGLIAEEVAEVYPDLVARSSDGQIETVKYQVLPAMLLNEVQRQDREIRLLEQQNQALQERLAKLEAAVAGNQSTNPR